MSIWGTYTVFCNQCGKLINVTACSEFDGRFCNMECFKEHQKKYYRSILGKDTPTDETRL